MTAAGPRISVVIPTYNRLEKTHEAIASVLAQAHPDVREILVIDDASAPAFVYLPESGRQDVPVRVLRHSENRGAAAARNTGIRAACGELLAFLDSDDLWLPGKVSAQLATYDQDPAVMRGIGTGFCKNRNGEDLKRPSGREAGKSAAFWPIGASQPILFASGCWFCPGSTLLLPRAAFDQIGLFDEGLRRLEDLDWYLRFSLAGGRLDIAPVLGSLIRLSGYPQADLVARSVQDFDAIWTGRSLPPPLRRRLDAYFALERAASTWRDPRVPSLMRWMRTGSALLRSFTLVPRARLHLEKFWTPAPAGAERSRPETPGNRPRDAR